MWTFGNVFDDKHRRIDILVCWLDGKLTCENTNRAVNFFLPFLKQFNHNTETINTNVLIYVIITDTERIIKSTTSQIDLICICDYKRWW